MVNGKVQPACSWAKPGNIGFTTDSIQAAKAPGRPQCVCPAGPLTNGGSKWDQRLLLRGIQKNSNERSVGSNSIHQILAGARPTWAHCSREDTGRVPDVKVSTKHARRPNRGGPVFDHIYTTQVLRENGPGDVECSRMVYPVGISNAQNFKSPGWISTMGGPSRASVRGSTAKRERNGPPGPGVHRGGRHQPFPIRRLLVGDPNQCFTLADFVYPASTGAGIGGYSMPKGLSPINGRSTADFGGRNPPSGMPAALASAFANPNGWR